MTLDDEIMRARKQAKSDARHERPYDHKKFQDPFLREQYSQSYFALMAAYRAAKERHCDCRRNQNCR